MSHSDRVRGYASECVDEGMKADLNREKAHGADECEHEEQTLPALTTNEQDSCTTNSVGDMNQMIFDLILFSGTSCTHKAVPFQSVHMEQHIKYGISCPPMA
ncbi:hypothetical protein ILYODFUR_030000 [Ilyodon furcidens]|uniref:Uncharacterized protein n=1 Tax=Ilyodon furcidens TaxID=33524 RepID=A0ABV0UXM5_9TELE